MLCIGGPKHGVDVKCDGPYFEMPVSDRVQRLSAETGLPMVVAPRWRTVRYERRTFVSDGRYVDVFIVP